MPKMLLLPALWQLFWLQLKSLPQCRLGCEANATITHSCVYSKVAEFHISEEKSNVRLVIQLS